ncbi:MAG TPA: ferritin family protein [Burkholderiales bacterium]|jgi:rubrerythrin|nr:ferritin family protein [Burkholderiales bacterium]
MGRRLLPRTLPELFAHALAVEREAMKRFEELAQFMRDTGFDHLAEELEAIGREEREQHDTLALGTADRRLPEISSWEYAWHHLGPQADKVAPPTSAREALALALAVERRTQFFYADVAENVSDDAVSAFAAEMAADEQRHIARLETLLQREPDPARRSDEPDGVMA